jgi:translation initiation factor 2 alpha subunit (eIF-2alpha)
MTMNKSKRWSQQVTNTSNALDLEQGVFSWDDPKRIALSLKRSADTSVRRKSSPFRSAMSMLNFYVNRAGKKLPLKQREILERAKEELRELYGRPRHSAH